MRHLTRVGLAAGVALGLLASAAGAADFTLKVSSPTNNDVTLKWMETFKSKVEEGSGGRIAVELYPANQLGQIPATIEGVSFGTIEVTAPASGFFVKLDQRYEVFDVPGFFDSFEKAQQVLSDPQVMERIADYGKSQGVTPIAAYPHGPLALLTVDGVRTVADLAGKKIRVAGPTPLYVEPYKEMGAQPLSMPLGEVMPALQNGAIDGLLAAVAVFPVAKFYDVAKPVTILPESYLIVVAAASTAFFDKIGPELEAVVRGSAREAVLVSNEWNLTAVNKAYELWTANGGEIIHLDEENTAAYLAAVEAVMPKVYEANSLLQGEMEALSAGAN